MKILKRLGGAAAVAALALSTVSVATPAHAVPGDATLSFAPTAILNEGSCVDHAFTYGVELPEGTTSWTLDVQMIGPDGVEHGSQLIGTFASNPVSGSDALQLCSLFEPLGTYTIQSSLDYTIGRSTTEGPVVVAGTFQVVRDAKTKATIKAKRKGAKVTATSKVTVSTGGAYGPVAEGGKVTFQKKVGKKWKKVARTTTDAAGIAKAKFKAKKGTRVRAVYAGAGEVLVGSGLPVPPAKSKTIRIR